MKAFLFILLTTSILFAQYQSDAIVFGTTDQLHYYDFNTGVLHQELLELGPTFNEVSSYGDNVIIVNSGVWGAGTNLQIIPKASFAAFNTSPDTIAFRESVMVTNLAPNGNAWSAVGFADSLVLVSLTQTKQLQIINHTNGDPVGIISDLPVGNPQVMCRAGDDHIAITMSNWGSGGSQIAFFDVHSRIIADSAETHLNPTGLLKLWDGHVLVTTSGSWGGGENNYSTLELLNVDSLGISHRYAFPDSHKVEGLYQINDSTVFTQVTFYGGEYGFTPLETKYGMLNLNTFTYTDTTSGFFVDNTIHGQLPAGHFLTSEWVSSEANTDIYTPDWQYVESIPVHLTNRIVSISYPASSIEVGGLNVVTSPQLHQNYPNPFNAQTTIRYTVGAYGNTPQRVELTIHTIMGQKITTLVSEKQLPGEYKIRWNASGFPSGVYFYQIITNGPNQATTIQTRKMMLIK